MKFTKNPFAIHTILKVWNDDKTECYGLVGQVGDFLYLTKILTYCDQPRDTWCFIPASKKYNTTFGATREEAIKSSLGDV